MQKTYFSAGFEKSIEGLRALAVLSVLIFHINPNYLPGGFIGVDLFFVISGYLISRNIINSYLSKKFSFKSFYFKRFKRLYPALVATVASSFVLALFFLSPPDLIKLVTSGVLALFGLSNVYFYSTVDYFNSDVLSHPLLHTWSLGLEEQFYLLWPVLVVSLLALTKSIRNTVFFLFCVSALSFGAMSMVGVKNPDAIFYLMPFRVFQFAMGFFALYLKRQLFKPLLSYTVICEAVFWVGVVGILYSLMFFDEEILWPGFHSLVPTFSIMLVLMFSSFAFSRVLLENALCLFFGRISYSLYLVHWPIIVFYKKWLIVPSKKIDEFWMFIASVLIGYFFYKVFEEKFSSKNIKHSNKVSQPLMPILISMGLTLTFAFVAVLFSGLPQRFSGRVNVAQAAELSFAGDLCDSSKRVCLIGDSSSKQNIFLVGDSHALNLVYGLDRLLTKENIKGTVIYDHGCLFLNKSLTFYKGTVDQNCKDNVEFAFSRLSSSESPVILVNSYLGYKDKLGSVFATESDYIEHLKNLLETSLLEVLKTDKKVLVFTPSYSTGVDLTKCSSAAVKNKNCRPSDYREAYARTQKMDEMILAVGLKHQNVTVFDPKSAFCVNSACQAFSDSGEFWFRDTTHLTNLGSKNLVEKKASELTKWLKTAFE